MPEFNPEKHYYGSVCKRGHGAELGFSMRYASNKSCVECMSIPQKNGDRREYDKTYKREYRKTEKGRETCKKATKKYKASEKGRECERKYRKTLRGQETKRCRSKRISKNNKFYEWLEANNDN